jgi:hypothetical protein
MKEVRLQLLQNHREVHDWSHRFIIRYETDLSNREGFETVVEWCRDRYGEPAEFGTPRSEHAVWTTDDLLLIFFHDDSLAFEFLARWC